MKSDKIKILTIIVNVLKSKGVKLTTVPHKEHCFGAGYDFRIGGTSSDLKIEDSTALCRICSIFSTCLLADSCCF